MKIKVAPQGLWRHNYDQTEQVGYYPWIQPTVTVTCTGGLKNDKIFWRVFINCADTFQST